MPQTLKKVEGAYCFGLVRAPVRSSTKNTLGDLNFMNRFLIKK